MKALPILSPWAVPQVTVTIPVDESVYSMLVIVESDPARINLPFFLWVPIPLFEGGSKNETFLDEGTLRILNTPLNSLDFSPWSIASSIWIEFSVAWFILVTVKVAVE